MHPEALAEIIEEALRILDSTDDGLQSVTSCRFIPSMKMKKSVRFSGTTSVFQTITIADMSKEEIQSYWWTAKSKKQLAKQPQLLSRRQTSEGRSSYKPHWVARSNLLRAALPREKYQVSRINPLCQIT
jgi:hypothetical protein